MNLFVPTAGSWWAIFSLLWFSCGAFECNDNVTIHNSYINCADPLHVADEVREKEFCVCCVFVYTNGDAANGVHIPVMTALQAATAKGQLSVVRDLVSSGTDVNDLCLDLGTPLAIAAWKGYLDITVYLVENGAEFDVPAGYDPIALAVRFNHTDVADYLISHKVNKSSRNQYDDCICCTIVWAEYPYGKPINVASPMVAACLTGTLEAVQDQVRRGADVNEDDCPLQMAAWKGYLDVVKFLVEQGAQINSHIFIEGYSKTATPLTMAIRHKHEAVAEYLRSKGGQESP